MRIEIDPTVDFACKLLLGNPEFPDITIHFLNAILRLPAPIVSVEIVNPIVWKEFEADKLSILDILAIDNADRRLKTQRRGAANETRFAGKEKELFAQRDEKLEAARERRRLRRAEAIQNVA